MGLQQVGPDGGAMVSGASLSISHGATVFKEFSLKEIFSINQVQWLGGRNSITPPAASPER